jgi:hypothetical protein
MRKNVTCFSAHPWQPRILLGFDSGILEEIVVGDECHPSASPRLTNSTHPSQCVNRRFVVGSHKESVQFTSYLRPHESIAYPISPPNSTRASYVPPSLILRHDLAVAIAGCSCFLLDLSLGVVCCTWVMPFNPQCTAVCGPLLALGPYSWRGEASSEVASVTHGSDWNDRHCLVLDVSCYRAGAIEVVQAVSKEKVNVMRHLSLYGKSMSRDELDALFASSCAHLVSTADKALRTLICVDGHVLSPFIAAVYTPLSLGVLVASKAGSSGKADCEISQTLHVEVHRIAPQGRTVACCAALRVSDLTPLLGATQSSFHAARPIGYYQNAETVLPRLMVVLTSGLVVLAPDNNTNNSTSNLSLDASTRSRNKLDSSFGHSASKLRPQVPCWVPQQLYRLSAFRNPIAQVVRSLSESNIVLIHKSGRVVSLDIRVLASAPEVQTPFSTTTSIKRPHILQPRPLSTASMWRVPTDVLRSITATPRGRLAEPVEVHACSAQSALFGFDSFSKELTVAPLQRPRSSVNSFIRRYCKVEVAASANDALRFIFQQVFVSVDILSTVHSNGLRHQCNMQLHRTGVDSLNNACSFSFVLPMEGDVAEIDVFDVWAVVNTASTHSATLTAAVRVNLYDTSPRPRQLSGAPKSEAAIIFLSLPCDKISFAEADSARRLGGRLLEECSAVFRSETDSILSFAVCAVTAVGWVLIETSARKMMVKSFNISDFVSSRNHEKGQLPRWLSQYQVDPTVTDITTPTHADESKCPHSPEALIILVHRRLGSIDILSGATGARRLHYSVPRRSHCDDAMLGNVVCRQFFGAQELSRSSQDSDGIDASMYVITTHASRATHARFGASQISHSDELRLHCAYVTHTTHDDVWLVGRPAKDATLHPWHSGGTADQAPISISWGPSSNLFLVSTAAHTSPSTWLVEASYGLAAPVDSRCHAGDVQAVHVLWRNVSGSRDDFGASLVTIAATVHLSLAPRSVSFRSHSNCLMIHSLGLRLPQFRLHAALLCALNPAPLSLRHPQLFTNNGNEEPDPVTAVQQLLQQCRSLERCRESLHASSLISTFGLCVRWLLRECAASLDVTLRGALTTSARWWLDAWVSGSRGLLFQLLRSVCVGEHDPETLAMVKTFLADNHRHQPTRAFISHSILAEWVCCVDAQWWASCVRFEAEEWLLGISSSALNRSDASRLVLNAISVTPFVGETFVAATFGSRDIYGVAAKALQNNVKVLLPFLEAPKVSADPPDPLQRFRRVLDSYMPPQLSDVDVSPQWTTSISMEGAFQSSQSPSLSTSECVGAATQPLETESIVSQRKWSWTALTTASNDVAHYDDVVDPAHVSQPISSLAISAQPTAEQEQAKFRRQFQRQASLTSDDDSDSDFADNGRYGMIDMRGAIVLRAKGEERPPIKSKNDVHPTESIPISSAPPTTKIYPTKTARSDRVGVHVSSSFEPLFESLEGKLPPPLAPGIPSQNLINRLGSAGGQRPQSSRRVAAELPPPPPVTSSDAELGINSPAAETHDIGASKPIQSRNTVHAHLTAKAADELVESALNAMDEQKFDSALTIFKSVEKSTGGTSTEVKLLCRAYRKICFALRSVSRSGEQLSPLQVTSEREAKLLAAALVLSEPGIRPFHLLFVALPLVEYCVNRNDMWRAAQAAANFATYLISTTCQDDAWSHMYLLWSHEHENLVGNLTSMCQAVEDYCSLRDGDPPEDQDPVLVNILMGDATPATTGNLFDFSD